MCAILACVHAFIVIIRRKVFLSVVRPIPVRCFFLISTTSTTVATLCPSGVQCQVLPWKPFLWWTLVIRSRSGVVLVRRNRSAEVRRWPASQRRTWAPATSSEPVGHATTVDDQFTAKILVALTALTFQVQYAMSYWHLVGMNLSSWGSVVPSADCSLFRRGIYSNSIIISYLYLFTNIKYRMTQRIIATGSVNIVFWQSSVQCCKYRMRAWLRGLPGELNWINCELVLKKAWIERS